MEELKARDEWMEFIERNDLDVPCADDYEDREQYLTKCTEFLRAVTKTDDYRRFVDRYIAPGDWASTRVGNLYSGSVFLSLMAILEAALRDGKSLDGKHILTFAYGSGSKAKVFSAKVMTGWEDIAGEFGLKHRLDNREEIDYETYESLHRCGRRDNVASRCEGGFFLADIHDTHDETEGARHYGYAASVMA